MTDNRASLWSITINNPTADDRESIALARQKGWKVLGQAERGENDTLHYQLALQTPQVRFSAVKKHFQRAHIEPARDRNALLRYVTKEATRVGELPTTQDKYPSLSKYWDLIYEYLNDSSRDGLDYDLLAEDEIQFYSIENRRLFEKTPLVFLDKATDSLIRRGYHVESLASNPSTRAMWNKYAKSILLRSHLAQKDVASQHNHANDDQDTLGGNTPTQLSCYCGSTHPEDETCNNSQSSRTDSEEGDD